MAELVNRHERKEIDFQLTGRCQSLFYEYAKFVNGKVWDSVLRATLDGKTRSRWAEHRNKHASGVLRHGVRITSFWIRRMSKVSLSYDQIWRNRVSWSPTIY